MGMFAIMYLFFPPTFLLGGAKTVKRGGMTHRNPAYQPDSTPVTPSPSNAKIEMTSIDVNPNIDMNSNDIKSDLKLTPEKAQFFIDPDTEQGHVNLAYVDHGDQIEKLPQTPNDLDPGNCTTAQPNLQSSSSGSSLNSSDLDLESATVSQLGSDLNLTSKDPRPEVDQGSLLSHGSTLTVNLDTDSVRLEGSFLEDDFSEQVLMTSNTSEPLSPELVKWDQLFEMSYSDTDDTPTMPLTPNTLTPTGSLTPRGSLTPENVTPTELGTFEIDTKPEALSPDNVTLTESVTLENVTPIDSLATDTEVILGKPRNSEDTYSSVTFNRPEDDGHKTGHDGQKTGHSDHVTFDVSQPVAPAISVSGVSSIGNHNALQPTAITKNEEKKNENRNKVLSKAIDFFKIKDNAVVIFMCMYL